MRHHGLQRVAVQEPGLSPYRGSAMGKLLSALAHPKMPRPGIGLQLSYRMRLSSSIPVMPRIASELARIIPKAPAARGASARRVLPLCLGGQAVRHPAFPSVKAAYEVLHVVP